MKKYIIISLLFHLALLLIVKNYQNLGDEKFNKIIPITFVVTNPSPNPGSPVVTSKEIEKKELPKPKPKEEKKSKKKEIKSKISTKEKKKNEEKNEEVQEIESKENKINDNENIVSENSVFSGSNFMTDGDGGYIALSSAGINYEILREVEPDYPSQAEMIGYSKKVIITVKFLVGLKGEIENIELIKSHPKLGFDKEVKKAIQEWRFKPIYHHGKNIKVYFVKDFIFNPR